MRNILELPADADHSTITSFYEISDPDTLHEILPHIFPSAEVAKTHLDAKVSEGKRLVALDIDDTVATELAYTWVSSWHKLVDTTMQAGDNFTSKSHHAVVDILERLKVSNEANRPEGLSDADYHASITGSLFVGIVAELARINLPIPDIMTNYYHSTLEDVTSLAKREYLEA